MKKTYLDHNATTPLDPRVRDQIMSVYDLGVGNPSSLHSFGRRTRRAIEDARADVATSLGVKDREIIFTSSATEANNLAVMGLVASAPPERRRILVSPLEHPSVLAPIERLQQNGYEVQWLPVTAEGVVDADQTIKMMDKNCALLTMMWVNNELGTIQPVDQLCERCLELDIPFHCDAVQTLGKHEVSLAHEGISTASFSAHKINGPLGSGLLFLRAEQRLLPQLIGGAQERERRAGTENVAAAVGMAASLSLAIAEQDERQARLKKLDAQLLQELRTHIPQFSLNSGDAARVPGSLNFRIPKLHGETALMRLDLAGFAISLGSACSAGSVEPSAVLRAIGLSLADNHASLRVSLGHQTQSDEVNEFVSALKEITKQKR